MARTDGSSPSLGFEQFGPLCFELSFLCFEVRAFVCYITAVGFIGLLKTMRIICGIFVQLSQFETRP